MPGVPTGRACDACRKQKKKCDEKQPACARCLRLKVNCVGSGQQRFKFKQQQFSPKSTQSGQMTLVPISRSTEDEKYPFEIPRTCPGNSMTALTNLFVGAIKRSTDLRYNMWWSFGLFLEDVPRRLGINEALDRAVDAVTIAHAGFCTRQPVSAEALSKYSHALKTLRVYLDDPLQASSSSTLCAVMILLICQTFIGNSGQLISGHAQGAASILHARKNFGPRDDFERKLFLSLRGSVLFEGLYNDAIDLSSEEWDTLVKNDFDQDQPEGRILRCLAQAPGLIKRGKRAIRDGEDLTPLAMEVRPIYEKCKLLLGELKARTVQFETSELSTMTGTFMARILRAHYLRTYGIGLAITTVFNCILQVLDPIDYASAWAVTTDPQLRSMVEVALIDYHGDFVTQDGVNIPRELEQASENLWLGSTAHINKPESAPEYHEQCRDIGSSLRRQPSDAPFLKISDHGSDSDIDRSYMKDSPAAKGNGFVFVSGQVAADSNGTYLPVEASVTEKTHKMIQNVKSILESSGSSLDQVIKANIIFVHLDRDYEEFNEVYKQYFPHNPARTSVEVSGLPKPADLEIEVIALAD
ncbi:YjgF/Yer057p/UK114 family [Penicillium expansum]|uniref:YjgF/Yer057p/UK114 family n=1 Tax=Penicillium expansum TaxID=27334 RepID=A0A0A2K4I0_PENEN|nr:YjgF/Yer057p/UK114 family [Penicillium expansum]KGO61971.1 YjgF/Yer057p/UK114 family [Penicillium expansum]